jgi:hypothetical protein
MRTLHIKQLAYAAALTVGTALAVPAQAVIPVYGSPGTQNAVNYNFTAGANGYLRTWFVGKGGAGYTVRLGAIVNGVDRGLGLNNQTATLGQLYNFGATTAGQSIKFYIFVTNTNETFTNNIADNADGVQHFYRGPAYTGGDFGIPLSAARPGSYFGAEDLNGGGDFNYTDLQFIARTGGIPEPATWAMLIFGFGLVGGALRRRQSGKQAVRVTYA